MRGASGGFVLVAHSKLSGGQLGGVGVEGERPEKVAAHSALHLIEAAGGVFDPLEAEYGVEAVELGAEVGVAKELGCAGAEEEQVL